MADCKKCNDTGMYAVADVENGPEYDRVEYCECEKGIARAIDENEYDDEPDIDDWTPPDYGPPGSGAVIVEYTGFEPGLADVDDW